MDIKSMAGIELTLSLDNYDKPLIKKGADAELTRVMRCIMRKQDNPLMGDINFNISKYRFEDMDDLDTSLATKISIHLSRVLPSVNISDLRVHKVNKNTLGITIEIMGISEKSKKKYLFHMSQGKDMTVSLDLDSIRDIT